MPASKTRTWVEWHGDKVIKAIQSISKYEELQASKRVAQRTLRYVPTGDYRRRWRRGLKHWMRRVPGTLKRTVKRLTSKFKDGGYIVMAGSYFAYYAGFVEFGTKMRRQKTTGRFTGKAKAVRYMRKPIKLEQMKFIRDLQKRIN